MRIAWFTPFSSKSAIGAVSGKICEELAKEHEVDLWTHSTRDLHKTSVNVIHFSSREDYPVLEAYDHIIYNIGNFAEYHSEIYRMSQKKSGIVILHDQTMNGFWREHCFYENSGTNKAGSMSGFFNMLRIYYGNAAAQEVEDAYINGRYDEFESKNAHYSLIEPVLKKSRGVFTHAGFFCESIKKFYNGPVGYSYLPCETEKVSKSGHEIFSVIETAGENGRKVIVSNGIVSPVKQIHRVTDVLEKNPELAEKIIYIVVGGYSGEYGDNLKRLSETTLKGCLYMLDYQPDSVMNGVISSADLCVNLRYPNSEVCSLSLLEQMSYGKPVLVINSGVYGEMPDDAVIKAEYESAEDGIIKVLNELINDPEAFNAAGANAGLFIKNNCTAEAYCSRLMDFLNTLNDSAAVSELQNRFIAGMAAGMRELGISGSGVPASFDRIVNSAADLLNADEKEAFSIKTIGVWAAFAYSVPGLHREGISRFMSYMIPALVRKYGLTAEVWCYSFNEGGIRTIFSQIPDNRIKIITEKNWTDIFSPGADIIEKAGIINESRDNLSAAARMVSDADVMLPMIVDLDSVIGTGKRVFVPAHDMAVSEHYDDFVERDAKYKSVQRDIASRAENLARNGAFFFSNSNEVRKNQILKYIRDLDEKKTGVVYLPVNIPEKIEENIIPEKDVRGKFGLEGRYLFYPTQIRPYKNVSLLIRALALIAGENKDLSLVLTGRPSDVPETEELIKKNDLTDRIVLLENVSEYELYSIYKYAAAVPVPTLFEGGFPWQACEALYMNVPAVISDIEVTVERIEACGFDRESCGLELFSPYDEQALAQALRNALEDRSAAVQRQQKFAKALFSYTWEDAAEKYYGLFNG